MVLYVTWNEFLGYGVAAGVSVLAVGSAIAFVVRLLRLAVESTTAAPDDPPAQVPGAPQDPPA